MNEATRKMIERWRELHAKSKGSNINAKFGIGTHRGEELFESLAFAWKNFGALANALEVAVQTLERIAVPMRTTKEKRTYGEVDGDLEVVAVEKIDAGESPIQFWQTTAAQKALARIEEIAGGGECQNDQP